MFSPLQLQILPYGVQLAINLQQTIQANRQKIAPSETQENLQDFDISDSPVARKKNKPRRT